jgi:hypothetical protein
MNGYDSTACRTSEVDARRCRNLIASFLIVLGTVYLFPDTSRCPRLSHGQHRFERQRAIATMRIGSLATRWTRWRRALSKAPRYVRIFVCATTASRSSASSGGARRQRGDRRSADRVWRHRVLGARPRLPEVDRRLREYRRVCQRERHADGIRDISQVTVGPDLPRGVADLDGVNATVSLTISGPTSRSAIWQSWFM